MAMAMAMVMAIVLLLFILAAPMVHSLQYNVTWDLGINYNNWGAGKTFTVGDTLVFNYTAEHALDVVDKTIYTSCSSWNALQTYSGGQTSITLTTPGPIYFICPIQGHCQAGMKLTITVAAAAASPTASASPPPAASTTTPVPSPSPSPSSSVLPSPAGSRTSGPSTGTAPVTAAAASSPESSGGAGRMFGDMNDLVVIGIAVVVAGLAGFSV